jgi:hypothetical protein
LQATTGGFRIDYADINKAIGSQIVNSDGAGGITTHTFTNSTNQPYIRIMFFNLLGALGTFTFTQPMLERGSTATTYESYKSSQANLPRILHSVPDGTADKWDVKSGVVTQNVSDVYTLQSGDIDSVINGY